VREEGREWDRVTERRREERDG